MERVFKGSTVTYRRDFLVCDQLDASTDFLIGAKFMLEQWSVLFSFGKMKRMIAGWFTHRKETAEVRARAQVLKTNQEQEAHKPSFVFEQGRLRRQERKKLVGDSKRLTEPRTANKSKMVLALPNR